MNFGDNIALKSSKIETYSIFYKIYISHIPLHYTSNKFLIL